MRSLADALEYENDDVVGAFRDKYNVSLEEAAAVFFEVKKWLWLCASTHGSDRPLVVFESMTWLDEMWHTFILFTQDYMQYCNDNFGFYIHHAPTSQAEKARAKHRHDVDPDAARTKSREGHRELMRLVFEMLGEQTLRTWFEDYAVRYAPDKLGKNVAGAAAA